MLYFLNVEKKCKVNLHLSIHQVLTEISYRFQDVHASHRTSFANLLFDENLKIPERVTLS
jgi:hypothetical protein